MDKIVDLNKEYYDWLSRNSSVNDLGNGWKEISTMFLDRHNDCLNLLVHKEGDQYRLSDDGYIISDLEMSGCPINTPKRKELLESTLNRFGVVLQDGKLSVVADSSNFLFQQHFLLLAMMSVNNLFYTSSAVENSVFTNQVNDWMDKSNIIYMPRIAKTGKSGFQHLFDFAIPKSKDKPERFIQTVSDFSKSKTEKLLFQWSDVKNEIENNAEMIAICDNKTSANACDAFSKALNKYGITYIPWDSRDRFIEYLSM